MKEQSRREFIESCLCWAVSAGLGCSLTSLCAGCIKEAEAKSGVRQHEKTKELLFEGTAKIDPDFEPAYLRLHRNGELKKRGDVNGIDLQVIDEDQLKEIEPNAKTFEKALYSPTTSTIDPKEICQSLKKELERKGVQFYFNSSYVGRESGDNVVFTSSGTHVKARKVINAAGLYADKVAKDFGHSKNYTIIPFKGIYLKYT